jgi:hypothetical protein
MDDPDPIYIDREVPVYIDRDVPRIVDREVIKYIDREVRYRDPEQDREGQAIRVDNEDLKGQLHMRTKEIEELNSVLYRLKGDMRN